MEDFLIHTKTKKEAIFFIELFDKMKVAYERKSSIRTKKSTIPNRETIKAIEELKNGKGIKFDSVKDLFESI